MTEQNSYEQILAKVFLDKYTPGSRQVSLLDKIWSMLRNRNWE